MHLNALNIESQNKSKLQNLLNKYANIFGNELGKIQGFKAHLYIKKDAQFRIFKPRPVPLSVKPKIEEDLLRLEKLGVIEKVETAEFGATPIVPVLKPNGKVRICADFKVSLNQNIDVQQYPLPRVDELLTVLRGGQKFSKIDLADAYLQIELDEESKKYCVITTHKGLYRYNRLPFGLSSAPAIFQSIIENIFRDIRGTGEYLDDVITTGCNDDEHFENLEKILNQLQKFGIKASKEKSIFFKEKIEYLGLEITKAGILPSKRKCDAILKMERPKDLAQLSSFLGMVNYYGMFIKNLSTISQPLNMLKQKAVEFRWGKEQEVAFTKLKNELASPAF